MFFVFFRTQDNNLKIVALLGCLVLFSGGFYFINHPKISAMHVPLYLLMADAFVVNRGRFSEERSAYPLKTATFLLFVSFVLSGLFGEEGGPYGMYTASRFFLDSYGFFLVAYIIGYRCDYKSLAELLYWPVIIFCGFEFLEAALKYNYVYSWLMNAFPGYEGILEKGGLVMNFNDSWRIRTSVTTVHPTTLGALLMTLFIFFFPRMKERDFKGILLFVVFVIAFFLSGSRTSWVCSALYILYHFAKARSIIVRLFFIVALAGGVYYVGNAFVDAFSVEGRGSSLDMRQRNLLICAVSFAQKPVTGHGFNYIGSLIERDGDDRAIDGAMESVFFNLMVEQGLVGLVSYFGFAGLCFVSFRKMRECDPKVAEIGEGLTICLVVFSLMSGTLGNLHSMNYLIQGTCLGMLCAKKEEAEENVVENETSEDSV